MIQHLLAFAVATSVFVACRDSKKSDTSSEKQAGQGSPAALASLSEAESGCQWKEGDEEEEASSQVCTDSEPERCSGGELTGRVIKQWHGLCDWKLSCAVDVRSFTLPVTKAENINVMNRSAGDGDSPRSTYRGGQNRFSYDTSKGAITFDFEACPFKGDQIEILFNEIKKGELKSQNP